MLVTKLCLPLKKQQKNEILKEENELISTKKLEVFDVMFYYSFKIFIFESVFFLNEKSHTLSTLQKKFLDEI